jgi:uncharacterized protein YbjT (DUF2867 family)
MPVIVVGADTDVGDLIVNRLHDPQREVRVFVTDEEVGQRLRDRGLKVAIGDVSDSSHVEAASTRCFTAILIEQAARDGRERSFATTPEDVIRGWADAVGRSKVQRVIWVTKGALPETPVAEVASVSPDDPDVADQVYELDDAHSIS